MTTPTGRSSIRLWIGVAVLAVGVLELMDAAGLYDADPLLSWWPVLLVALGLLLLARGLPSGRWFPGAVVLLVGGSLLGGRLGWLEDGLDKLWPLILVLLGLAIMSRGMRRGEREEHPARSRISRLAILAGIKPKVTATDWSGGDVSAVLGSCELDLTEAGLAESGAVLDLFALMGAIVIRVPPGWSVDSRVVPLMAGVEDSTEPAAGRPTARLELRGFVMMGGVEVKSG